MPRRGLTLLETLIAIGLVLALAALSFPALIGLLDQRRFDGAGDQLGELLRLARAHAQATGEPVEVLYEPEPRVVRARVFRLDDAASGTDPADDELPLFDAEDAPTPETVIPDGWAHRVLPDGVHLARRPPAADDVETGWSELDDRAPDPVRLPSEDPPFRLAVFLPDGSALLGRPAWVHDGEGRLARLSVDGWTGLATIQDAPPVTEEPGIDAEMDDPLVPDDEDFEPEDPT